MMILGHRGGLDGNPGIREWSNGGFRRHRSVAPETGAPRSDPSDCPKEKDPAIETLRGLAILLIVIGHVIGDVPNSGITVDASSIFRWWHETTRDLRTPLFFAISGYLYAQRPVVPGQFAAFAWGKARLLLLPFLSVGTLQYLFKTIAPGVNVSTRLADIWQIYVFGFDQFWFSQAAICIFLRAVLILPRRSLPIQSSPQMAGLHAAGDRRRAHRPEVADLQPRQLVAARCCRSSSWAACCPVPRRRAAARSCRPRRS